MNLRCYIVAFLVVIAIIGNQSEAQQIVVKNKAGEGQWTISFSRKHAPHVFELHTSCKTLTAAQAEAQKLIAWSNSMAANSSWRLAIIEIEGEEASAPKAEGPKLPDWQELANDFRAQLNETLPVLEDYMGQIAAAYDRAKTAKEGLLRTQGEITKEVFDRVNATVADYNRQLDTAQASPQGSAFARFPRMTPVDPELLRQANDWRKAKEDQFHLEEKKAALDRERERLAAERIRLIHDGRELREAEDQVAAQDRATPANPPPSGSLNGPFTLYTGQYSNTRGSKRGEYDSFTEARAIGRRHMSQNANKQPNYRITDRSGKDLEFAGLFGSKTVSDAEIRRSSAPPNNSVQNSETARARQDVSKRRTARNQQLAKYRSDLEAYNLAVEEYERMARSHATRLRDLSKMTYAPPTGTPPTR